jgi:hypothetical protein
MTLVFSAESILADLIKQATAHNDKMDDKANGGLNSSSPNGDDYNEMLSLILDAQVKLEAAKKNIMQHAVLELENAETVEREELIGSQKAPTKFVLRSASNCILLSPHLPSEIEHEIAIESDRGLVAVRLYVSSAHRNSDADDLGLLHDSPALTVKMGSNQSLIEISPDGHINQDIQFKIDHDTGLVSQINPSEYDQIIEDEQKAAAAVPSSKENLAPAPVHSA